MGWPGTGDIAIAVLTSAMAAGQLEDIGQRKPVLKNRIAGNRTRHVEMVIEQLGRNARASFGSEDCKFKSNTRDYTMQITRCVEE